MYAAPPRLCLSRTQKRVMCTRHAVHDLRQGHPRVLRRRGGVWGGAWGGVWGGVSLFESTGVTRN
jgi:hypothetical protein